MILGRRGAGVRERVKSEVGDWLRMGKPWEREDEFYRDDFTNTN